MKKDNGITLIALVITIIVMLILVIVTVSFAMNGGLFSRAREGSEGYRTSQFKEAVAVVKSEIYADYYSGKIQSSQITAGYIEQELTKYLAGSDITVASCTGSNGNYSITPGGGTIDTTAVTMVIDFQQTTASTNTGT